MKCSGSPDGRHFWNDAGTHEVTGEEYPMECSYCGEDEGGNDAGLGTVASVLFGARVADDEVYQAMSFMPEGALIIFDPEERV